MSTALLTGNPAIDLGGSGGNVVYIPSICNVKSKPAATVTYNIPSQYTPCKMGIFLCTNLKNISENGEFLQPSSIICGVGQEVKIGIADNLSDDYHITVTITFESNKIIFKVSERMQSSNGIQVNIDAILAS